MEEKIISCTWGYSMILVEFAKIIDNTPKKVRCVMIDQKEVSDGFLRGTTYPDPDKIISKPFLLKIISDKDGKVVGYKGSYPYTGENRRMGTFRIYEGNGESFDHCD